MPSTTNGCFFVPRTSPSHKRNSRTINIWYQNVRGLRTKTSHFISLVESSGSDLFAATETGCNQSIRNTEIVPAGFSVLRCDRADGRKLGGALLAAAPQLELRQIPTPDEIDVDKFNFEIVCATVYTHDRFLFACCVVYIPPQTGENDYIVMFDVIEKVCIKYKENVIILGDFNLYSCPYNVLNYYEYFVSFCELIQCNTVPNCDGRQLDLVLSARGGVTVTVADEALRPVDAYHPPLAVEAVVAARLAACDSPTNSMDNQDSPRELRNRAEKQRRDKLNQSIALLASLVPPVVAMGRKIDKTTIMKLTAHYLRSHQYVFGDSINNGQYFKLESTNALLSLLKGFVLTVTYRGLIVVVSHNIRQLLGYSELDLIGTNVYSIIHEQDHEAFREHMFPRSVLLGKHGELLIPDEPGGADDVALALARERKTFVVRFKKLTHRSEPLKYMMCHVEGSFRKADKACRILNRCCQLVRRARARGENPRSSGNDVVFVGVVRPLADTFMSESVMESFRMEYRTRHSVDGEIIQCEQRIALVTGYMTSEVNGVNAMNFMHRDDVRWVIVALREMYDQHRLFGESCYRLMTKNGEFVYMRSRGRLDVDESSNIVTSFVCTNTVVGEEEGKHFINQMKKRFNILVNNGANSIFTRDENEPHDDNSIPVEDPVQLEKVILYLVTNLPSPETSGDDTFGLGYQRISIIPPKKERIVNAIKRIENILHPSIFAEMEAKRARKSFGSRTEANDGSDEEKMVSSSTSIVPSIVQPSISTLTTEPNRQIVVPSDQLMTTPSPQAFGMPQTSFEAFEMMTNRHLSLSPTQVDQDAVTYQEFGCIHDSNFRFQELQDLQNNPTSSYYDHNRLDLIDWGSVFSGNELVASTSSDNMQNMQINENPLDLTSSFGRNLNLDSFNIYTPEVNMQINENPLALTSSFRTDLNLDQFNIYTPEENMQINENPIALTSSYGRDLNLDSFKTYTPEDYGHEEFNRNRITPSKSSNSNESVVDSRFDSACSKVIDPYFADNLQLQEGRDRHASEKRASRKRPRDDDDYNRNYNQRRPHNKHFKGKGRGKHSRSQ